MDYDILVYVLHQRPDVLGGIRIFFVSFWVYPLFECLSAQY